MAIDAIWRRWTLAKEHVAARTDSACLTPARQLYATAHASRQLDLYTQAPILSGYANRPGHRPGVAGRAGVFVRNALLAAKAFEEFLEVDGLGLPVPVCLVGDGHEFHDRLAVSAVEHVLFSRGAACL